MLDNLIASVVSPDIEAMNRCRARLDILTKPVGSLGGLEELAVRLAGITGREKPHKLKKSIILMAADHGVAVEGVSAYPQEVTLQMVNNFCRGGAAINVFARHAGAELVLVDVGVNAEVSALAGVLREKVSPGTANITVGPAMTTEQAIGAINAGIRAVRSEIDKGVEVVGLGDMGIGNTTVSTAIISCFSKLSVDALTGVGTGISPAARKKKVNTIERALAINKPDPSDPLGVLTKVGGLDIGGLVGVILGAAAGRAAVVIDGLIAAAAALIAVRMAPAAADYLIGSHLSAEPGHKVALDLIGVPAYLKLDMRLGEGTGAALGMSLIDAALQALNEMKTFSEAQVSVAQDGPGKSI